MKYGLLCYSNSGNLGDEIQSIAAKRFLPRVDALVNRDLLSEFESEGGEAVRLICNGWFGHQPENWPPSPALIPLLVSMHISDHRGSGMTRIAAADFLLRDPVREYLMKWGPVGARDLHTLRLLEKAAVPCYFSGCVTLTLSRFTDVETRRLVVLNDLPDAVVAHIRDRSDYPILLTSHTDSHTPTAEGRFARAEQLLRYYQSAICVITSRLHCALPCLALGTPVFVVDVFKDQTRYSGLSNLYRHCSVAEFLSGESGFDIDHPEPNSDDFLSFRSSLEQRISDFIKRDENSSPDIGLDETWMLRSRLQTLVAVHADQSRRFSEMKTQLSKRKRIRKLVVRASRTLRP